MRDDALICPDPSTVPAIPGAPVPLGVLASGSGTNFAAIADAIDAGRLNARIACVVYNRPEATVAERAEARGVPAVLVDHREFDDRERFDGRVVEVLGAHGVDWVVMAGWMRIATATLIDAYPNRIVNIHPSLLPSFPGLRAVEQALAAGVRIAGCTVHLVSPEVDCGPILAQAAVPVLPGDTAETLHGRIQVQEHRLYPMGIALAITSCPGDGD